jgi:hypothetical protein
MEEAQENSVTLPVLNNKATGSCYSSLNLESKAQFAIWLKVLGHS